MVFGHRKPTHEHIQMKFGMCRPWVCSSTPNLILIGKRGSVQVREPQKVKICPQLWFLATGSRYNKHIQMKFGLWALYLPSLPFLSCHLPNRNKQRNGGRSLCVQISRERRYPLPIYWYHSKGNWLRYSFAADSFYTMKLCSRLVVYFIVDIVRKTTNLGIWSRGVREWLSCSHSLPTPI